MLILEKMFISVVYFGKISAFLKWIYNFALSKLLACYYVDRFPK